jgi:hypothetical protein
MLGALLVAAAVALILVSSESGSSCDVRIRGGCAELRSGIPIDTPDVVDSLAEHVIDADPDPDQLSARCRFRGITRDRFDVHDCTVLELGTVIQLRIVADRTGERYSYEVLNEPDRTRFAGRRGTCNRLTGNC